MRKSYLVQVCLVIPLAANRGQQRINSLSSTVDFKPRQAKVSSDPLIITCALRSLHKSLSQSVPEPGLHLSQLISSHQGHHQVRRSEAPLLRQHLVDQHGVCAAAHPHELDVKTRAGVSGVTLCRFFSSFLKRLLCCCTFPLVLVEPTKSMSPTLPAAQ